MKTNSKCIIYLNVNYENIKLLEKHMRESCGLKLYKDFL